MKMNISWDGTIARKTQGPAIFFLQLHPSMSLVIFPFVHRYQLTIIWILALFEAVNTPLEPGDEGSIGL